MIVYVNRGVPGRLAKGREGGLDIPALYKTHLRSDYQRYAINKVAAVRKAIHTRHTTDILEPTALRKDEEEERCEDVSANAKHLLDSTCLEK